MGCPRQPALWCDEHGAEVADVLARLGDYDVILHNHSAGKDSMAALDMLYQHARERGVGDRVTVAHADLGRVEWEGVPDLARAHAERYGLRFEIAAARNGDLLDRVRQRGMWPSPAQRWCTSDLKRGPLVRVITALVAEQRQRLGRRVRVLNVMGMRAQESPARAKLPAVSPNERASNGRREVTDVLPIHDWDEQQVWQRIAASRIADLVHPAYTEHGMGRLSCSLCIFAPRQALVRAARARPALAREYARIEAEIGHTFKHDLSLAEVLAAAEAGEAGEDDDQTIRWAA